MITLGTHFEVLLENLQPTQERLDAARTWPRKVRDFLADHETFATLSPHTRLAGSYAQHMSVGDVKDVDFLVRVDGDPEENKPEAKTLIRDLNSALNELPKALGLEGFATMDVERARRSVHVYIKDADFHIDAVPCIAPNGFEDILYVPDHGFNQWIASHPIGYVMLLDELNTKYGGKVKPLGKLLKHFRNYQMTNRRPKSYWLGALLLHHVSQSDGLDMTQTLAGLFHELVDAIYLQYDHLLWINDTATPNISDPLLGHNISWNWGRPAFETFMRRLDDGRQWSEKALNAMEKDDKPKAIEYWQKAFGADYFPTEITENASRFAMAGMPGNSYVTATGLVTAQVPSSGIYTPTKPTTFHGNQS
jgi:hypothetical protein